MSLYSYAMRRASSYWSASSVSLMSPRRQADSAIRPFGVARQQVLIDARLVVEAFEVAGGDQLDEVAIAFLVFAQQHQVVVAVRYRCLTVWPCCATYTSQPITGWTPVGLGRVVELHRAEQIAVVGHGDRRHLLLATRSSSTARFRRRRRAASSRCGSADGRKERRASRSYFICCGAWRP